MKLSILLAESRSCFDQKPFEINPKEEGGIFTLGAKWMFQWMQHFNLVSNHLTLRSYPYNLAGIFKYGVSIIISTLVALLLLRISMWLEPIVIILFYIVEVHFLFLFPIIIANDRNSFIKSIKLTYRIGYFSSLVKLIGIAGFMLIGFLNRKHPLKNWYIGCLAIIIWYKHAMEHR